MGAFTPLLILAYVGAGHSSLDPSPSAELRTANAVNESSQTLDREEPEMAPPEDELTNEGCKTCVWGSPLNAHDKNNALNLELKKAHTSPSNMSAAAEAMKNGLIDSDPDVKINFRPRIANAKLTRRWPSAEVPYTIENTFSASHRAVIQAGIDDITAKTCVSFREKVESDLDWMEIISTGADGCSANAAFYGPGHGAHSVKLALDGCVHKSIVIHELLHILSVSHEQQRPNRDQYVDMHWMNMVVCKTSNMWRFAGIDEDLDKLDKCELDVDGNGDLVKEPKDFSNCVSPNTKVDDFGVPYDYTSVMHYSLKAFALNFGQNVMTPKNGYTGAIGGDTMSAADITRLQRAYSCKETEPYDYNGCGGVRYSATGGNMDGTLANGCEWILKTDPQKGITINFSQFSVPGDCSKEYVEVRGGISDEGPIIGKFCESNAPPSSLATKHNAIYVKYVKKSSGSTASWEATWTASEMTCCAKVVYEKSSVGGAYSLVDGAKYQGFPVYKNDDEDKYMVACPKFNMWVISGGNYASAQSCPSYYNTNKDAGAYCPHDAIGSWSTSGGTEIVDSKVRCSDCQLYPEEPECATCCDKVVLEGLEFQTSFNGLYEKQDTLVGGRPVYKQDGNYYLVFDGDGWYGKTNLQGGSNIKNEDEVYCPGKITSPWQAYTGAWTPQTNSNTRCSDCTLYPAQDECVQCCSKVIMTSDNPSFTNMNYPFKPNGDDSASWTATGEQANGKLVYKNDAFADYCLWTSPCGKWATNVCTLVPSQTKCSSYISSSEASKCPHSAAWSSGIQVKCGASCSSDPHAAPEGGTSDWDSSTKLGGTIVTYTCSTGKEVKAICDAGSLAWKPASIQCKAQTAAPTPAPTPAKTTKKPEPKTTKKPGSKTTKKPGPKPTKSPGGKKPGPKPIKPGKKPGKPAPKPGKKPGKPSKKPGESKPSKKPGESKPSKKPGESKPAKKPGVLKPSKKPGKPSKKPGESKPSKKPGESKPSKKPGESKPAQKPGKGTKPAKKPGESKPGNKPGKGPKPGKTGPKPIKPGKKPVKPGKKPEKPGKKPEKPGKKPEKPGKKPDKPSKKPGKPINKPGEPKPAKKPGKGKKEGKNGR